MKTAFTFLTISLAFIAHAERLILKYPATVTIVDDSGKRTGTKRLKAGTEISICESAASTTASKATADSPKGKVTGISPTQFIAEKRTTPTTFIAEAKLEPDPYAPEPRLSEKHHWCAEMTVYGKTSDSREFMKGFAPKGALIGQKVFAALKDGETHIWLVTFHACHNTEYPNCVKITDFKELSKDDPRAQALDL